MRLLEQLGGHRPEGDEEAADLTRILAFVRAHDRPFDRAILAGHLTGSALVLAPAGEKVLLLHHRKLDRWLQPGGHGEPGELAGETVALREAREETGLAVTLHEAAPRPLDVDIHAIPARPGEPAHEHLDLRYLAVASADAPLRPGSGESERLRWFGWDEVGGLGLDPGLVRALVKARRYF